MKIHRWIISLVFCCCVTFLSAQIRGTEITVVVSPDHTDWKYQLKEECSFTIQVYKAQNLLPGVVIDYELGPEWYPVEKKKGVLLKDGKTSVTGCMYVPGFLRCKVRASVDGHVYEGLATVAYAPEELRPHTSLPADFRQFWDTVLKEARQIPLLPTMELIPERCTDKVNVFHVSFQNICNGSRTFGILCIPKKPGKYPALLRVPYIFAGMQVGLSTCWMAVLAAEMVSSTEGVGWTITAGQENGDMTQIFVGIIAIAVVGLLLAVLMRWAERVLCRWRERGT